MSLVIILDGVSENYDPFNLVSMMDSSIEQIQFEDFSIMGS